MATMAPARVKHPQPAPDAVRSSSERLLGVMDLFTETKPSWTVEGLGRELGLSRTTAYRYAKTLCDTGFLTSLNAGVYVLGPRIIQLDRQIRLNDPLLQVAPPLMNAIRKRAGGIQLLCVFYGEQVMCIHDVREDKDIPSGYDRGRPFPLFRGGPSRIILAHLPQRQLKDLMLNHPGEIARAGLGDDWKTFSDKLKQIRQAGYLAARGEMNVDTFGISVPIMHGNGLAGSFTIGRRLEDITERELPGLIKLAVDTAGKISDGIRAIHASASLERGSSQGGGR